MRFLATTTFAFLISGILGYNNDTFNYRATMDRDFGPVRWGQVTCDEPGVCLGWPDGYESRRGWNLTANQCVWCPDASFFTHPECAAHRQSPISLDRTTLGILDHANTTECKDYHWMAYFPGSCKWNDIIDNYSSLLRNNFIIDRHALQITQPVDTQGDLKCGFSQNKFPRIDFALGYPEWWIMYQTEIKMPSEHSQMGKQYDAEVQLDHVYSIDRNQREIAKIAIFLQGYDSEEKWDFLEKLICQWREVEETNRKACCLPSVPMYAACRNPVREACGEESNVALNFDCSAHSHVNFSQMCNDDDDDDDAGGGGCCESPRSDTNYCHGIYDIFGESIESACYHCCEPSKDVAPPAPQHTFYPRIQCSSIQEDMSRICKTDGGCCDPEYSGSEFCQGVYDNHPGDEIHSICWYCCSEPKEVGVTGGDEFKMEDELSASSFDCLAHSDANFQRICQDDGCCESPRSDSNFCHRNYDRFGDDIKSVCAHCCELSKQVGPPAPDHPEYPRIECSSIGENTARICKPGGCCNHERSSSKFCQQIYENHSEDEMHSICWYCCSEPKDIGRRNLRSSRNGAAEMIHGEDDEGIQVGMSEYDLVQRIRIDDANFEDNHEIDSDTTGDDLLRRRRLVNYEDVEYHPYEWMHKVKTEYYYRYEGSQTVPPCFSKVHWRVMKDPIRVHPDQIRELQRLLAHRIAPFGSQSSCDLDTAGKLVEANIVEVNRPLQSRTDLHRMVFCECKDWTSKFDEDRDWCDITDINERFYEHPYNFDTSGAF